MTKMYFATKQKKEPSLGRIIVVILLLVGAALGGVQVYYRLGDSIISRPEVSASVLDTYESARTLFEEGDLDNATQTLKPVLARLRDPSLAPKALILQADIELASGRPEQALPFLERAMKDYSASPEYPLVTARYARLIEESGRNTEALALFEELAQTAAPGWKAAGLNGIARHLETGGDTVAARERYREALLDAPWNSAEWDEAADGLGRINSALIFSRNETPESRFYTIEPGDNLNQIGIKLNTTQGLLTIANGIEDDGTRLRPGQRLKYTPKDFRIVIERSTCRLFLLDKDGLFKRYRVGLGKPGYETTPGQYTIGNKQKDPTWFKPGAGPVPPNDPENELGTRWMPLVPNEEGLPTDLGIHGTIAPETIGHYASRGCPRMLKEDVEELYDLVVRSTPVEILDVLDEAMIAHISG